MDERLKLLLLDKYDNFVDKTVLIIGLGGVGSYAVEMLCRSMFKRLIIVDNDTIDITNLNRQLMTNINNVGKYKTDVLFDRIKSINPNCEIIKITEFITKENIDILFSYDVDYVIDACDTILTKLEIIKYCLKNKVKFISSMGMANRIDASKIEVTSLDKTYNDPLARKIRSLLKKENIKGKVMVAYSTELPKKIDKLGSIATVPATAGVMCANFIINDILKGC